MAIGDRAMVLVGEEGDIIKTSDLCITCLFAHHLIHSLMNVMQANDIGLFLLCSGSILPSP